MDAGTGILPSVRNATGGVFHAERAWAADATSVKIGGVELNSSTPYYVNGQATNDANQNWMAKFENGTLTLNGLNLNLEANKDIQGIVATGDLTIKLIGTNSITQNGTRNAIRAGFALTISGAGTLTVRDSADSPNSLIYAEGKIEIKEGAVIDAAKTGGRAQTINAHGGNLTVTGSNTSVKAVNHGSVENSDAIRVDLNGGSGNGTVTISDGATLEAETAADDAVAINAWLLKVSSGQDYIARKGESLAEVNKKITMTPETSPSAYSKAVYGEFKEKAVKVLGPNYLTFTAEGGNSNVTLNYALGTGVQYKKYTKTGNTWGEWTTYNAGETITLTNIGDKVSFKGKNVKTGADNHFTMTGKIAASGSVTSLTDGKGNDPNVPSEDLYYFGMFSGCKSLTTAPELPAVKLAAQCYEFMFYGCTNLTTAPELPATSLAEKCYEEMFNNCTSLTTAPKLPATSLAESCYEEMFKSCTSLTTAPDLLATEAKASCYSEMFYDCKSLTTAPDLPATKLANNCYHLMFYGCSALQAAPELPATNLAYSCYSNMFTGCSALKEVPTLPATTLAKGCYQKMFSGCNGLTTVPELPATQLEKECYAGMFSGCTGISIKEKLDAANGYTVAWSIPSSGMATFGEGAAEGSYAWNTNMFAGCSDVDFGSNSKMPQANVEGGTAYVYYQKGSNSGGETHTHTTPTQWTTSEKEHWYVCSECNQEIVGSRKAHSTAAEPNKATCQKAATCDVCGKTYGEKAAHVADTTKWVYDAADHWRVCKNCKAVMDNTKTAHDFENGKCKGCDYKEGSTVNPTPNTIPSGSSGGGYVAPSTDVKTSGSADSKVTSSPSTVQNETRTDASGKQETVAKVTVSAANQREILSQAKANKSKRIIIQIAKTAVQGDAKLELNLDKSFVQSILHDTEASLTIRTADGDRVISREALKTLLAQTEGNTVTIDPAAQENPTDPVEPSKEETLAALDSSRLVARSKLVTLKNGRKGIRITWSDRNGAEMNFDGVEIYRSTKKNRFGKKPFYATKGGKSAGYYINSKSLKSGVTYYYKVRGYVLIDGQKHYTDLSLKAIRTVK